MVTLEEIIVIDAPIERCFDLARSIEVHLAGNRRSGEEAVAGLTIECVTSGLIGLGQQVTWRATHLGVRQHLTSEITAMRRPEYFQDRMVKGAFRFLEHDHFFRALSPLRTELRDIFRFAAPVPILGRIAEALVLRRYMSRLLRERNVVLKQIAESSLSMESIQCQ